MVLAIQITAIIGLLLSIYTLYVEKKMEKSKNYKALCDISDKISCTKAFGTNYGHILGISNAIPGIGFYILILILTYYNQLNFIFYFSALSFLASIYLAYIIYFKLKNFCLVCNGIYVVNLLLLIFSYSILY